MGLGHVAGYRQGGWLPPRRVGRGGCQIGMLMGREWAWITPPLSILPLLMVLCLCPRPRESFPFPSFPSGNRKPIFPPRSLGGFTAPKAASRAAADVLSAAPFLRTHSSAPTSPFPTPCPCAARHSGAPPARRPATHAARRQPAVLAASSRVSQPHALRQTTPPRDPTRPTPRRPPTPRPKPGRRRRPPRNSAAPTSQKPLLLVTVLVVCASLRTRTNLN